MVSRNFFHFYVIHIFAESLTRGSHYIQRIFCLSLFLIIMDRTCSEFSPKYFKRKMNQLKKVLNCLFQITDFWCSVFIWGRSIFENGYFNKVCLFATWREIAWWVLFKMLNKSNKNFEEKMRGFRCYLNVPCTNQAFKTMWIIS